jgi:hypothetical protein
LESQTSHD